MRFCDGTMRIYLGHCNLKRVGRPVAAVASALRLPHFLLGFALMLALFCGCQTDKNKKLVSALRVHIQVAVPTSTSQTITVLRSTPVLITVLKDPAITEAD